MIFLICFACLLFLLLEVLCLEQTTQILYVI